MTGKMFSLFCLAVLLSCPCRGQETNIKDDGGRTQMVQVGDIAPDWELVGSDGKTYKLADYKGKRMVVVAWYPAALTGG